MSVSQLHARPSVEPRHFARPPSSGPAALVLCYGEGDTTVTALRNVSLEIQEARLTAIMRPSARASRR
jgi:hypothetical protein